METLEETLAEVNDGRSTTEGTATTETEKRSSSPDRRPGDDDDVHDVLRVDPGFGVRPDAPRRAAARARGGGVGDARERARAYHLDRVAAFAAAATASPKVKANAADAFAESLLRLCAETAFANATVPVVSRAFCPTRVHSHACDPPVGFRTNAGPTGLMTRVPAVAPYGPEDLPLGARRSRRRPAAARGATECPHARCGEHPAARTCASSTFAAGGSRCARGGTSARALARMDPSRMDPSRMDPSARRRRRPTRTSRGRTGAGVGVAAARRLFFHRATVTWRRVPTRRRRASRRLASPCRSARSSSVSRGSWRCSGWTFFLEMFLEMFPETFPEEETETETEKTENETRASETEEEGAAVFCRHASPRRRAHYFGSVLGTVCFTHDEMFPLALVVSPATDEDEGTRAASVSTECARPVSTLRAPRGDTGTVSHENHEKQRDARCASAAYALRSDAYAEAMGAFPEPSDPLAFVSRSAREAKRASFGASIARKRLVPLMTTSF